jgi:hypothetical protein
MADVEEYNVSTGARTERSYTQSELDQIEVSKPTAEQKWSEIRAKRNYLLHETDWASLADSPAISDAMKTYRQDLRDIPSQSDVDNITWPSKP